MVNKIKTWVTLFFIVGLFLGFLLFWPSSTTETEVVEKEVAGIWIGAELEDVTTGETFTLSELTNQGKPILLESFAVWCPTCTRQQQEIKKLHSDPQVGESFISVSIDTDPNEDAERIREHIEKNGFDWRYIVAPIEFTQDLIDQFGVSIVNAPSAPVILICPEGGVRKLDSGVKDVNELKEELARGC